MNQAQESSGSIPGDVGGDVGSSSSSIRDSIFQNKKFEEYEGITDPRLRAEGGSLSRYSIKADLSYGGPDLADLSDKDRPNPDLSNQPTETNISGRISARYRINSQSGIGFGTGVKDIYPVDGSYSSDRVDGEERYQVSTPFLGYDYSVRLGDWQARNGVTLTRTTYPSLIRTGQEGSASYEASFVYDFKHTRYSMELDESFTGYFYDRPYQYAPYPGPYPSHPGGGPRIHTSLLGDGRSTDERIMFSPSLRYAFSDRLLATTGLMVAWDHYRYRINGTRLYPETVGQSLGVSYSFTRDIFIFPFIGFYPARLATDMTTVNVAAIFSVF